MIYTIRLVAIFIKLQIQEPGGKYYKFKKNIFYKQIATVADQIAVPHNNINVLKNN